MKCGRCQVIGSYFSLPIPSANPMLRSLLLTYSHMLSQHTRTHSVSPARDKQSYTTFFTIRAFISFKGLFDLIREVLWQGEKFRFICLADFSIPNAIHIFRNNTNFAISILGLVIDFIAKYIAINKMNLRRMWRAQLYLTHSLSNVNERNRMQ